MAVTGSSQFTFFNDNGHKCLGSTTSSQRARKDVYTMITKIMDLRFVVEGAGTSRCKKHTEQMVGWRRLKIWIRRRIGRWMARHGRGRRREGVGLQKRILRLLADLGKIFQLEPNLRTQLSGHVLGTTGKSGVANNNKVELALSQLSTAQTGSQVTELGPPGGY